MDPRRQGMLLMVVVFALLQMCGTPSAEEKKDSAGPAFSEQDAADARMGAEGDGLWGWSWEFLKGEKARNAVAIGMWSRHFYAHSDYRTTHNLVGIQYNGFFAGTFANSHSHQVFTAGIARAVYQKDLGSGFLFEAGYKLGPMYGYREGIPNFHRWSVLPLACFSFSFHNVGIDINLVPGNALSFNGRINF